LFVLFLTLDPWFQWSKENEIREKLSIYLDTSISMQSQFEYDNIKISQLKSEINKWSEMNNVETQWYLFGEQVREASIREIGIFSDSLTDFSAIPNHAIINNERQLILITDGQSNSSMGIEHLDFDEDLIINVIGVGSDRILNDIWIENIIAPSQIFVEDSVIIKITMGYELFKDVNGELIFNLTQKDDYSTTVKIQSGVGFIDIERSFLADQIIGLNKIEIHSDVIETNIENNTNLIHIKVNEHKKGILLVSSGLSPNTSLIKSLITKLPPHMLTHLYKKNNLEWDLDISNVLEDSSIQLVIFDDFPANIKDTQIYQKIVENSKWKDFHRIYFEGPKSNASTGEIVSKELSSSVRITDSINNLKIDYFNELSILKTVDLSSIPPSKKQMVWESIPENIIYGFDDNSAAIIKKNNFCGVFIQDAQEVILAENKNHQSALKNILSDLLLYAFTGDGNLLKVTAEKQKYMVNSPITFNIEKSLMLDDGSINIQINDSTGNSVKEIKLSTMEISSQPQFISFPGAYTAISSFAINGAEEIESKPFHFRIIKNLIEESNLFENKKELENLAWENGGTYADPNHLDVVLSAVNSHPKSQLKEYKFSALSTQRYWWMLIILLSIEWFLRKREGLL